MYQKQKPLKVLMATPRYFPETGGTEMHVYEVGRRLVKSGVDVTLLTTIPHTHIGSIPTEEKIEGMRVVRLHAWSQPPEFFITPGISSFIQQEHWDLIHCQGCHTLFPVLVMRAARKGKIPYVTTFHSGGHSSHLRTRLRDTQWKVIRPLLANAERLVGVSSFEANYFRNVLQLPEKQFTVIPNGFSVSDQPSPTEKKAIEPGLIVSVGRLERYKGHHHLIQALPRVRETHPDAHLLILGAGPYETTLRKLTQQLGMTEHVTIRAIPANSRQEMMSQLSQAALVTLYSEYESQGIAIMEALALQRPVLVANTSALQEFAEKKLVRSVALNSTPEELAAAIVRQLDDPLIPEQLDLPTWDDCAKSLNMLYHTATRQTSNCF
ncbi:glycosyltransferase family 4 protein [Dictyobacter aurantiacus]|uniref:glycosyltransferase family 4 protein n=1 Tax=Dictyobacter aurantiacus TaxID=1936993 RepID=UPI000F81D416|nr:glycosyltransferase family 4 protein [Dictyobacter aurantiacus]